MTMGVEALAERDRMVVGGEKQIEDLLTIGRKTGLNP